MTPGKASLLLATGSASTGAPVSGRSYRAFDESFLSIPPFVGSTSAKNSHNTGVPVRLLTGVHWLTSNYCDGMAHYMSFQSGVAAQCGRHHSGGMHEHIARHWFAYSSRTRATRRALIWFGSSIDLTSNQRFLACSDVDGSQTLLLLGAAN
jgi:hypothetical protein